MTFSTSKLFGMTIRESATDGSDFTNPDADYRRLFLGEDGQLHVKDTAGAVTEIGGGGGLTHAYIGYNTVGASKEVWGAVARVKQVTLASPGFLMTIEFYVDQAADNVYTTPVAGVWEDASGAAGVQIFAGSPAAGAYYGGPVATYPARWIAVACGLYLPAGTYWIGGGSGVGCNLYYDTSGSDRGWTFSAGTVVTDGARWTQSDTTKKYSIRGSLLS
jgi:hypothetical protein